MTTKVVRKIVKIDEEKCNGCGLCIPECNEGALQIIDGKAKLVSEVYCDGLGACLGHCPQDAITIEEREANEFDEEAVEQFLESKKDEVSQARPGGPASSAGNAGETPALHPSPPEGGCPSARLMTFERKKRAPVEGAGTSQAPQESALTQWPVQLTLVPVGAPYLKNADLLIAADCVPFAFADFHRELLEGKKLLIACPKLDDTGPYLQKLAAIFEECDIRSITVAHMEVPCCFGLVNLVHEALKLSGKDIPLKDVTLSIQGDVREEDVAGANSLRMPHRHHSGSAEIR